MMQQDTLRTIASGLNTDDSRMLYHHLEQLDGLAKRLKNTAVGALHGSIDTGSDCFEILKDFFHLYYDQQRRLWTDDPFLLTPIPAPADLNNLRYVLLSDPNKIIEAVGLHNTPDLLAELRSTLAGEIGVVYDLYPDYTAAVQFPEDVSPRDQNITSDILIDQSGLRPLPFQAIQHLPRVMEVAHLILRDQRLKFDDTLCDAPNDH